MAEDDTEKEELDTGKAEIEEGQEEEEEKKKSKLLLILLPLVLLLLIGGGLYFTGMLDSFMSKKPSETVDGEADKDGDKDEKGGEKAEKGGKDQKKKGKDDYDDDYDDEENEGEESHLKKGVGEIVFIPVPDLLVNINTSSNTPRFLKLKIQLEVDGEDQAATIEEKLPRIIDKFQTYLRELREEDLRGSKGNYRLKIELLSRVNTAVAPAKVNDVLFQEILIQ